MAKSRNRPEHKEKKEKYVKEKSKQIKSYLNIMANSQTETVTNNETVNNNPVQPNQLPAVRQSPVWKSTDTITLSGQEFEYIYNYVQAASNAFTACQSVMARHLVDGTIKMEFEKLLHDQNGNPINYQRMNEEEAAPHKEEFEKLLDTLRANQNAPAAETETPATPSVNDETESTTPVVPIS